MITRFCVRVWSSKLDWTCSALLQLVERCSLIAEPHLSLVQDKIPRLVICCQLSIPSLDTDLGTWLLPRTLNSFHLSFLISINLFKAQKYGIHFSLMHKSTLHAFVPFIDKPWIWLPHGFRIEIEPEELYWFDLDNRLSIFSTLFFCNCRKGRKENSVFMIHQYWTFQIKRDNSRKSFLITFGSDLTVQRHCRQMIYIADITFEV